MVDRKTVFNGAVSMLLCICMLLCVACAPAPAAETTDATEASQIPSQPNDEIKNDEPDTSTGRHVS